MLPRPLDLLSSFMASTARLWQGIHTARPGARPAERLILYDFEGCPYCRRAREAVSMLDLEVEIRPCPTSGPRFRPEVIAQGGRAQFPWLIDPGADTALYESADIVAWLFDRYGSGRVPWLLRGPLFVLTSTLASTLRLMQGKAYRGDPDKAPAEPLIFYGVEGSPYCRIVREALSELELPYLLRTTPVGSARWAEVKAAGAPGTVPYLIDPNTDTALFESADIRRYLYAQYG